ncbi:hypothetical protein Y032_0118g767 [Ancylostoma ceylanicum]|uniref:Uncharacterized protein n=1 Tax=Ancylostoma ceylanicum TaxID=53326 RepID=A0A016TBN1_9BILA|nr:hypothetical protein Y032_0118g767 [Ancylostoma ceylanicum]
MMLLIILSLAIPGSCMNYSHYLARNISLTLCDAAYMSNPSDSLRSKLSASDVQGFYAELDGGSCSGLIVTLPKRNIVALAFSPFSLLTYYICAVNHYHHYHAFPDPIPTAGTRNVNARRRELQGGPHEV